MSEQAPARTATVLVYSDDRSTRDQVRLALGRRVAADLPDIEVFDCATHQAVSKALDAGGIDLVILDGEATPAGGLGVCHQLKDEIADCPPVIVLIARVADAWLATWSRADAVQAHPIDPRALPEAAATLLRSRLAQAAQR